MSLPEICKALDKGKSTVYYHLSKYRTKEVTKLYKSSGSKKAAHTNCVRSKEKAIQKAVDLFEENKNDLFFLQGIALYWAEGTKSKLGFANTDHRMISVMIKWFSKYLKCQSNYYVQTKKVEESLIYWSESLSIDKSEIKCYCKSNNTRKKFGVFYIRLSYADVGNVHVFIETLINEYTNLLL